MDLKTLRALPSITKRKRPKRVGRGPGSGVGKTCGRGHKGAGARSGNKLLDYYEGGQMPLYRRFPKRGFSNAMFKKTYAVLNLTVFNAFGDDASITPQTLQKKGLVKNLRDGLKILGDGELTVKNLKVTAHRFSKSAKARLEAAGCTVTETAPAKPKNPTARDFKRWADEKAAKNGGKSAKGGPKKKKKG